MYKTLCDIKLSKENCNYQEEIRQLKAEIAKLKICLDESKQREEIARKVIDDKNREIEKLKLNDYEPRCDVRQLRQGVYVEGLHVHARLFGLLPLRSGEGRDRLSRLHDDTAGIYRAYVP